MKLYMVRHGETDWNKAKKVQGRADIPLNAYGRELAEKTAEGLRGIPFDLAYTSPLSRAKETAQIVLQGRKTPLIEEPRRSALVIMKALCIEEKAWIRRVRSL